MARCTDCIHYEACLKFADLRVILCGDKADTKCIMFKPTADVAPKAEWISVEEMVPGGNGVFLVALKESGYENLVYFDVRRYEDGEWRNIPDKLTVSHWMPLPEPPKGD